MEKVRDASVAYKALRPILLAYGEEAEEGDDFQTERDETDVEQLMDEF